MKMPESISKGRIPADVIKLIAVATMLIDHVGAIFMDDLSPGLYTAMRAIGRIAFPLFAFLLVEGYFHTRDVKKYLLRLALLAVISEIPFDFAFYSHTGSLFYWGHQSIFVTLFTGLASVALIDRIRVKGMFAKSLPYPAQLFLQVLILFLSGVLVDLLGGDYGFMGVYLILVLYYLRDSRIAQAVGLLVWLLYYDWSVGAIVELYGAVAILPILGYNGQKGTLPLPKWFFYGFYPAHVLILALIRNLLG